MTSECTCMSKFSKFVTYHLLSYVNRYKLVSVMNCDCMADEVR